MSTVGPFPEIWNPKFPEFLREQVIFKALIDVVRIANLSNDVFFAVKAQKMSFFECSTSLLMSFAISLLTA